MLLKIFTDITLPVFILIGLGIFIDRTLHVDLSTLTRLNFNVFLPALVFIKTLDSGLSAARFGSVTLINLVHTALLFALAWGLFSLPFYRGSRPVLTLSGMLPNAGNYGIPLATLAFGAEGANVMAIVVMLQIIITVTLGLWVIDSGRSNLREVAIGFFKVPLLWSVIAALALLALRIDLPPVVRIPTNYVAGGLVPLALITLGVQLSRSSFGAQWKTLPLVTVFRLFVSPLLAFGLVKAWDALFGNNLGVAGPVLVIAAGMPVAVNVFILAAEYNEDTGLASQTILWTTALSALTLTGWLAFLAV